MANISITTECNRSCSYCFSFGRRTGLSETPAHMSLDIYRRILSSLGASGVDEIRLLGGEPSLHPEFAEFVDLALDQGFGVVIFSNGFISEDYLCFLQTRHQSRISLLINTLVPGRDDEKAILEQNASLMRLGSMAGLGINLFSPGIDPGFLIQRVDELGVSRTVRIGLAHPCLEKNNRFLHPRHYPMVGRRLIDFFEASDAAGIQVDLDCGFVPCMFPEQDRERILDGFPDIGRRCNPILDFLPDQTVVSCFPLSKIQKTAVTVQSREQTLRKDFSRVFETFHGLGIYPGCSLCKYKRSGECTGGCLAASLNRLRPIPVYHYMKGGPCNIQVPVESNADRRFIGPGPDTTEPDQKKVSDKKWCLPYVDQPMEFWEEIAHSFGPDISEIYFPLPGFSDSGRPLQATDHLTQFLTNSGLTGAALVNPVLLSQPVGKVAGSVIGALERLHQTYGISRVTVSDLMLAQQIKEAMPEMVITGSVLMEIASPIQAKMVSDICQTLVPASGIMRDVKALKALKKAFCGKIRLMVNEACLPGCPFRVQHFYEMGVLQHAAPASLCEKTLSAHPWMRLTGAFVLPQHLYMFDSLYDELKIAGRATLQKPEDYIRVVDAYINRKPLAPDQIGGGPASVQVPVEIEDSFYKKTLTCSHHCHDCDLCRQYYKKKRLPDDHQPFETGFKKIHPDLPVFHIQSKGRNYLYASSGRAVPVAGPDVKAIENRFRTVRPQRGLSTEGTVAAAKMIRQAKKAEQMHHDWLSSPFEPECLTVSPGNQCNLSCGYCYSKKRITRLSGEKIVFASETALKAASERVARCCAKKNLPFHLVLHGGGEPALNLDRVRQWVRLTQDVADEYGIGWFSYLATNGVMAEQTAAWLAENITHIGISCDGPPQIQDVQRPLKNGKPSSGAVEQTARIFQSYARSLDIRSTITRKSMTDQAEIVSYLAGELGADTIRFEPVYCAEPANGLGFQPSDADLFINHFLAAQQRADQLGVTLSFAGIQVNEIHGPYCDVLRHVLRLTPEGTAANCFLDGRLRAPESFFRIGKLDSGSKGFVVDHHKAEMLKQRVGLINGACKDCINQYHCSFGCPDKCLFFPGADQTPLGSFRCRVFQQLAIHTLTEEARQTQDKPAPGLSSSDPILSLLDQIPASVDLDTILDQYGRAKENCDFRTHTMPPPPWEQNGFDDPGPSALAEARSLAARKNESDPMSIYIHIPFCHQTCGFCDCYSFYFRKQSAEQENRFVNALVNEIRFWAGQGKLGQRPVTTIHFGGGTPNCLSVSHFEKILQECHIGFNLSSQTELAIETTAGRMGRNGLAALKNWGFSRIHVGVQTLDDPMRKTLGRRTEAADVIKRINNALDMGFVTSVDLLYGLPGQTLPDWARTLEELMENQVSGFSLYQLNESRRNKFFLSKLGTLKNKGIYDYLMLQTADQMLLKNGYIKNYYNHYAGCEDENLYFTYPQRGEDLLAMGPSADGVFDTYIYRHGSYGHYMKGAGKNRVSLEGGMVLPQVDRMAAPAALALLKGALTQRTVAQLDIGRLVKSWMDSRCLEEMPEEYRLTANGTWFVHQMLEQVKGEMSSRLKHA